MLFEHVLVSPRQNRRNKRSQKVIRLNRSMATGNKVYFETKQGA